MQTFTPNKPPKSGQAKRLWDWWIKHRGEPPLELWVNRPGKWQRAAGTCHYGFQLRGNNAYLVWDVERTLAITPDDAIPARMHGYYYLE
jgi:hypothetical protein